MRRFFIDPKNIHEDTATLEGQDARHLKNVLRLDTGDTICLIDGSGMEYPSRITGIHPDRVTLDIISRDLRSVEPPIRITVAQAYLKDKKMDTLVRQLTELGMTRFLPFQAARSVPRPDKAKQKTRKERWEKIARESLKQCRRTCLPEISDTLSFDELIDHNGAHDLNILFWENSTTPLMSLAHEKKTIRSIQILLGPEGGFTDQEAGRAMEKGFIPASLGPRILKAETASTAALALIQFIFGDMG